MHDITAIDALAEDAIRQYRAGKTVPLRSLLDVPSDEQYLHSPGWQRMLAEAAEDMRAERVRVVTVDELMDEVEEKGEG